jgi:hypothetical protein
MNVGCEEPATIITFNCFDLHLVNENSIDAASNKDILSDDLEHSNPEDNEPRFLTESSGEDEGVVLSTAPLPPLSTVPTSATKGNITNKKRRRNTRDRARDKQRNENKRQKRDMVKQWVNNVMQARWLT